MEGGQELEQPVASTSSAPGTGSETEETKGNNSKTKKTDKEEKEKDRSESRISVLMGRKRGKVRKLCIIFPADNRHPPLGGGASWGARV